MNGKFHMQVKKPNDLNGLKKFLPNMLLGWCNIKKKRKRQHFFQAFKEEGYKVKMIINLIFFPFWCNLNMTTEETSLIAWVVYVLIH